MGCKATFEQTLNVVVFAVTVPNLVVAVTSEWLFGIPADLLSGHDYWWVSAMQGEFDPVVGAVWNTYVIGVYSTLQYVWAIALGSIAVKRVQRIPAWAAAVTMLLAFAVYMFLAATFVR